MAICNSCNQEMSTGVGCSANKTIEIGDEKFDSIAADRDCHDCLCPKGTRHHPGCDMERCPKCRGQLISCGCLGE